MVAVCVIYHRKTLALGVLPWDNDLMIELTEDEFEAITAALQMANSPYTEEDVPELVALEAKAWATVRQVQSRAVQSVPDPASAASLPS